MTLLSIKKITKKYGSLTAVNDISFDVEKGEVLGLLGPNGAGKSTTISMISTLIKPDQGTILYNGENSIERPKSLQKKLGVVPQEIALYPTLSGYENLVFWGKAYGLKGAELKRRIEEVSEVIGITERLKDRLENYSGGMKRRINIGAALLHSPEILIMDEPTVGIDPQSRHHILETVKALNAQGMTIIYTSHYMEEVEFLCDRIAIMDEGKIIAAGTKEALIASVGEFKKLHISFDVVTEALIDRMEEIDFVKKVDVQGDKLVLHIENKEDFFQDIIKAVDVIDGHIVSYDLERPNLEGVFLHLTGKGLRD